MKQSWMPYLSLRAPRYTSFPSALHFDDSVGADAYRARLETCPPYEAISLYVHVPFCRQLCWYCGCNMRVERNYARAEAYVDALICELEMVGQALEGRGHPVSVHFGGGTPNFLSVDDLSRILFAIECTVGLTDDAPLAIEVDPRLLAAGDVTALAETGFSRMSIGIQDFDPVVQSLINREQSFDLVEACVSEMRSVNITDISFDLLYGLPGQTPERFADTLDKVVALSPDRVSVFGYAHLPAALPNQRLIDETQLPDDTLRAVLMMQADETLIREGYRRIGFDHYAKPDNGLARAAREGRLRRNFQGFTDDVADTLLGFGATAISFIDGLYIQNEKTIKGYEAAIAGGCLPAARGIVRSASDNVFAKTIADLLCQGETDLRPVLAASTAAHANGICAHLECFAKDGIISWQQDKVRLSPEAYALARVVATAFDPYVPEGTRLSLAV